MEEIVLNINYVMFTWNPPKLQSMSLSIIEDEEDPFPVKFSKEE